MDTRKTRTGIPAWPRTLLPLTSCYPSLGAPHFPAALRYRVLTSTYTYSLRIIDERPHFGYKLHEICHGTGVYPGGRWKGEAVGGGKRNDDCRTYQSLSII